VFLAKFRLVHPYVIGIMLGVLLVGTAFSVALVARAATAASQHNTAAAKATATPKPNYPSGAYSQLAGDHPVGAEFADFYKKNNGALWLGKAISPELPDGQNVVQIFEGGMLRVGAGTTKTVTRVPLAQELIQQNVVIPIADASSTLTYSALASKASGDNLVTAPWWWDATKDPTVAGIFLAQSIREGVAYGYYIPATFVPLLQKLGSWQEIIGSVMTQAIDGSFVQNGVTHHYTMQAFTDAILWVDNTTTATPTATGTTAATGTPAATSPPVVQVQHIGNDYVAMHGFPQVTLTKGSAAWTTGSPMGINGGPNSGGTVAHFLTPFSVQLVGDSQWVGHDLWLHIQWTNFTKTRDGWVNADQVALTQPANLGLQLAALDALSSQAQAAANAHGTNVAMSVYDPATGHYYVYNPYEALEMASMFKIPILVTLLHEIEQQGRELRDDEVSDTTSMIEVSDNDAEGRMYDDAGGHGAIANYIKSLGITDMQINDGGIGSTLMSPLSSVRLIELLRTGKILNAKHTQYALSIMSQVVSYQRAGVCDTAPSGASCSMKIGYGLAINGFLMDAMGTVTYKGHVYDMAIYSTFNDGFGAGQDVVDSVCQAAVNAMF
jgi:hypothetical protein